MAYQLQKDPREPNYARRLPTLRELQKPSELVKEDPDTAVNVLRAWIGNSGNAN